MRVSGWSGGGLTARLGSRPGRLGVASHPWSGRKHAAAGWRWAVLLAASRSAAFALGAALGDADAAGGSRSPSTLPAPAAGRTADRRRPQRHRACSPRLRAAIGEGRLAGVVLFADNFPSRAAGRRLIARLQAIRRPPALRDPLLMMVDQEGGLVKRVDGAPTASAAADGRPRCRLQPRAGPAHRGQPARARRQRRPRAGPRRRPARRHDRRDRTRLRRQRRSRSSATAIPFAAGAAGGRRRRHRQALPRPRARRRRTPTSRCSGSTSRRRSCARSTRRPTAPSSPPAATW